MATAYCTDRELKDVYPHVDDFDNKVPIYGWVSTTLDSLTYYISYDTGLVTQLFIDGKAQQSGKQTIGTTSATLINSSGATYAVDATTIVVDDGGTLTDSTYIKIGNEILGITAKSTHSITVTRGELGTTPSTIADDTPVYLHYQPSANGDWLFDPDNDFVIVKGNDPNDLLTEAGEDFSTLKTRYRENASRYLESKIDKNLPREQFKDKDGNYDYVIVRTTALLAAAFLIRSHDPTSEVAASFWEEANAEIEKLNSGENTLSWMTTADGSKGIVRESSVSGNIRIVDTRGRYSGTYDRIGVKITNAGAIGTAKYSVWVKDSDNIGAERMNNGVTANLVDEVINGQYQSLTGGLQIKFGGDTADEATLNDKWEVEVSGYYEEVDNATSMRAVRMTRK